MNLFVDLMETQQVLVDRLFERSVIGAKVFDGKPEQVLGDLADQVWRAAG